MSKRILLIGAGPTSSIIAYKLKSLQSLKCSLEVVIWEKSRGSGGRFATSRSPNDEKCIADLGAQYMTHTKSRSFAKPYFESLAQNNVIRPFSTNTISGFRQNENEDRENYVCSKGTASVVKFFLGQADIKTISFNKRVVAIISDKNSKKIQVVSENEKEAEEFDIVISTMPTPQVLQLRNANDLLMEPKLKEDLASVTYTSRFALGLFYKEKLALKGGEGALNYIDNDPVLRYWTVENEKRSLGSSTNSEKDTAQSSVVIHTTTKFGADNVEKSLDEMKTILLKEIDGRFKTLEGISPDYVKCHKWRYSQVDKGYPNSPGFVELSQSPIILACGDGFTFSGLEGCILSAERTLDHLVSSLNEQS